MKIIKIWILSRKGNENEVEIVKQIDKACRTAAQIADKQVEIEKTTEFALFDGVSMNVMKTPILIIDRVAEFHSKAPPVDFVRQCLTKNDHMPPPSM